LIENIKFIILGFNLA